MKPKFNATNGMLCWNRGGEVEVGPWPDKTEWSKKYKMSALACYPHVKQMEFEQRKTLIFIEAIYLIVRDRCNPDSVHAALANLEEYQDGLADELHHDLRKKVDK